MFFQHFYVMKILQSPEKQIEFEDLAVTCLSEWGASSSTVARIIEKAVINKSYPLIEKSNNPPPQSYIKSIIHKAKKVLDEPNSSNDGIAKLIEVLRNNDINKDAVQFFRYVMSKRKYNMECNIDRIPIKNLHKEAANRGFKSFSDLTDEARQITLELLSSGFNYTVEKIGNTEILECYEHTKHRNSSAERFKLIINDTLSLKYDVTFFKVTARAADGSLATEVLHVLIHIMLTMVFPHHKLCHYL